MKRLFCLLPLFALLILLSACGSNELFKNAAPENAVMLLTVSDKSGTRQYQLSYDSAEREILDKLSSVSAKPIEWTPDELEYPVYSLETGSKDRTWFNVGWNGGVLLTSDGSAYSFDFEFDKLIDGYNWSEKEQYDFPTSSCQRLLCERDGKWYVENMIKPEKISYLRTYSPVDGVSLEITEITPKDDSYTISAVIRNNSGEEFFFGKYYRLEVKLDGEWYYAPTLPDRPLFVENIGLVLDDGGSMDMSYSLWNWGKLPAGSYRLVVYGMTAEFTIE